jgi:hypothetical protein
MDFTEKYCIDSERLEEKNKDKKILSDDAFAIGEVIDQLIKKIEQTRLSLRE